MLEYYLGSRGGGGGLRTDHGGNCFKKTYGKTYVVYCYVFCCCVSSAEVVTAMVFTRAFTAMIFYCYGYDCRGFTCTAMVVIIWFSNKTKKHIVC